MSSTSQSPPNSFSAPSCPSFPSEVWSQVFDGLNFGEMMVASHVCRLLQSSAHAHPTFWRDIELSKTNIRQLMLFRLRLQMSHFDSRPICLRINLDAPFHRRGRMRIHRQVLQEIIGVMHRVKYLDIDCAMGLHPEMKDVLESPAPQLCTLRVRMLYSRGGDDFDGYLPRGFLSGSAPFLNQVELDGYDSAWEDMERGFTSVRKVVCSGYLLERLPSLFPNVVDLVLSPRELDPDDLEENARQYLLRVPRITFDGTMDDVEGPSAPTIDFLAPRTEYTLLDVTIWQLIQALRQLKGPLALQCNEEFCENDVPEPLTFTSLANGMARMFIDTGRIYNSAASLFYLDEPESVEMVLRITNCTFTIGTRGESTTTGFGQIRRSVLQYLPALMELTIILAGACDGHEYDWPSDEDLEIELERQAVSEDEPRIPYSNELRKLVVKGDDLSRVDAEGLVVATKYFVERTGDVTIELQIRNSVDTTVLDLLKTHFRLSRS